ncbi:hypothetical protein BCR32DRAFT_202025, partial [Anaeromyces robustus]
GYKYCSNQNTVVEYVDSIGNWDIENGKLYVIGYSRCSFGILSYNCCSSVNPEIIKIDENSKWGEENGQWCDIVDPTNTISATPTSTVKFTSDCYIKTIIHFVDESDKWSVENGD